MRNRPFSCQEAPQVSRQDQGLTPEEPRRPARPPAPRLSGAIASSELSAAAHERPDARAYDRGLETFVRYSLVSGSGLDLPGVIPFVNKHPESLISHERRPDLRAARPVAQPLTERDLTHRERSTSLPGRHLDDAMTSGSEFTSGKPAMQRMDGYPGPGQSGWAPSTRDSRSCAR